MSRLNKLHVIYAAWIAFGALCFFLTGCMTSKPHVAHSAGGTYSISDPLAGYAETVIQGDNSKTGSRLHREYLTYDDNGKVVALSRTTVELGTSRNPVITVPPAPDWTPTIVVVAGVLCLVGGGILGWAFKHPKLGTRLGLIGGGLVIIGITAGQYAWAYALCLIVGGGYVLWEMYTAYKKGTQDTDSPVRDLNEFKTD